MDLDAMVRKWKSIIPVLLVPIVIGCGGESESPKTNVTTGAAGLVADNFEQLANKNVGLVTNHSAVVGDSLLIDVLDNAPNVRLKALFSPEHGIRGQEDAGAIIDNSVDEETGVPIYSLYGKTRKPTAEMLEGIDVLVFDMQDVGARFYTYIATMGYTMQAAAEQGIPYVVLDRPNPLGGIKVEGFVPEKDYETFNGLYPIPITHGMTVGEIAKMIKGEAFLQNLDDLDLTVNKVQGWERDMLWPDMELKWIPPSPNIPDFETALIYPGACLVEATHMSEGRGTMEPFLQIGAPWADGNALAEELNSKNLPGLTFKATTFTPEPIEGMDSSPKHEGKQLPAVRYQITSFGKVEPVAAGIHMLLAFYHSAPDSVRGDFFRASRLNTLAGSEQFYDMVKGGKSAGYIIQQWKEEVQAFKEQRKPYLLY